jgi:hypothetical protein
MQAEPLPVCHCQAKSNSRKSAVASMDGLGQRPVAVAGAHVVRHKRNREERDKPAGRQEGRKVTRQSAGTRDMRVGGTGTGRQVEISSNTMHALVAVDTPTPCCCCCCRQYPHTCCYHSRGSSNTKSSASKQGLSVSPRGVLSHHAE